MSAPPPGGQQPPYWQPPSGYQAPLPPTWQGQHPPPDWPPAPASYSSHHRARAPRRRGRALIICGGLTAVLGVAGLLYISRAETLCGSGIGVFAQALNHQDAAYCAQDNDFHSASIVVLLIGLTLAGTGVVRMIMASAAHAAEQSQGPRYPGWRS
jgi:hypothetical protein